MLLYPPLPGMGAAETVSSLRWEQTRLGLQDLALLEMLRGLCDDAPPAGDDEAAAAAVRRGRRALAGVTRVISRMPAVKPPNDLPFTVNVAVLEAARGEVLAAIAGLLI